MLSTLHTRTLAKRRNAERGFTLIELLVVIVIIGILAAIAIPAFLNQRQTARDASVTSDVRNAATEVQTAMANLPDANFFAVASGTFTTAADARAGAVAYGAFTTANAAGKVTFVIGNESGGTVTGSTMVVANLSHGGRIAIKKSSIAGGYVISGYNPSGKAFNSESNALEWDSAAGGLQN